MKQTNQKQNTQNNKKIKLLMSELNSTLDLYYENVFESHKESKKKSRSHQIVLSFFNRTRQDLRL